MLRGSILHGGLRRQRAALLHKLEGLSERDARLPRTPTGTNLLGLVKHAAVIELEYFGETFDRPAEVQLPWAAAGQSEEDNVDMFAAEGESLEDVLEFARRCFAHADATITALGADAPGRVAWWPDDKAEVTLAQIDHSHHGGAFRRCRVGHECAQYPEERCAEPGTDDRDRGDIGWVGTECEGADAHCGAERQGTGRIQADGAGGTPL